MLLQGLYFAIKYNFNTACNILMYSHDKEFLSEKNNDRFVTQFVISLGAG